MSERGQREQDELHHNHDPNFLCPLCFANGEKAAHATYEDVEDEPDEVERAQMHIQHRCDQRCPCYHRGKREERERAKQIAKEGGFQCDCTKAGCEHDRMRESIANEIDHDTSQCHSG